jgi:hypothetical protein
VPPNKALEQTNGAVAEMEAPFAAQRQCSTDVFLTVGSRGATAARHGASVPQGLRRPSLVPVQSSSVVAGCTSSRAGCAAEPSVLEGAGELRMIVLSRGASQPLLQARSPIP